MAVSSSGMRLVTEGDSVSLPVPPGLRGQTLPVQLRARPSPPAVSAASGPRLVEVREGGPPNQTLAGKQLKEPNQSQLVQG